jgi:hypothetical protein
MSSFYVTLPSNSSMDFFPNNTLSTYVTKLPQPFDLKGEWEVGLSEIQFPITWYNVDEKEAQLYCVALHDGESMELVSWKNISPPHGHYANAESLIKQINDAIGSNEKMVDFPIRFEYNEISKKITMRFENEDVSSTTYLVMSKSLAELLGFEFDAVPDIMTNKELIAITAGGEKTYTGKRVSDLQRGFYSLFVYCDVVEPTVVGDVKVPLLRTVNISGKEGETANRIFETVQYMPLHRKQFETIGINIRDDTGRSVPFQRGKVVVTLHFRLKRPAYF